MKVLYYIYQTCIAAPIILIATILTSIITILGCFLGNGHFWGYYPGKCWSWLIVRVLLLPVKIEIKGSLKANTSYVFVANHQGTMDIFLIYAFLGRNFKWMMKKGLRSIPFVGIACEKSHQIFVDKSGPKKIEKTIQNAKAILREGMSLAVFPEGARTFNGHMGLFRKGAFFLADELQLPVVPLTIDGSFNVLPRTRGLINFVNWHSLRLVVHEPILPKGRGNENIQYLKQESYQAIMNSLPLEHQGYSPNRDQ